MKLTDEQIREELKAMVGDSEKEAVAMAPILTEIPKDADAKGWILRKLPYKVRGLVCAFFTVAGMIIAIVVTEDGLEQSYNHHKPLVYAAAVDVADLADDTTTKVVELESSAQRKVASDDFWRFPYTPSRPDFPYNPPALPAGTSNTAAYPVTFGMFSGTNFAGITGGYAINTDGVAVIEIVPKKPIV
jgi:hypothetical protein